jgi:hypothetical protein
MAVSDTSPESGSRCFLDKDRVCGADCAAFNPKKGACRLIERSAVISGAFRQLMNWLRQYDPPKV